MSLMEHYVSAQRKNQLFQQKHPVVNYMGGVSYRWNPLDTLKLVTASSIFGEPAYYRNGAFAEAGIDKVTDGIFSPRQIPAAQIRHISNDDKHQENKNDNQNGQHSSKQLVHFLSRGSIFQFC